MKCPSPFLACALLGLAAAGLAQEFPARPVKMIVPLPPSGASDVMARLIAQKLGEGWRHPVVIENRPSGGTVVGTHVVATAPPDGHTIGMVISAHTINPTLRKDLPYDTLKDLAPITQIGNTVMAFVAHPSLPASDVAGLIAEAKKRPGELNYASLGVGTATHLAGELLKIRTGSSLIRVPYNGSAPAYQDLFAGRVTTGFVVLQSALPHVRSGQLKVLGITGAMRSDVYPEFPAIGETVGGYAMDSMFGFVAPGATPREIVSKLGADIARALRASDTKARFAEIVASTPEEFGAFIRAEIEKWAPVLKASGAKVE